MQATQAPWQAMLQQTWSAQWPEMQPVSSLHGSPGPACPQLPLAKSHECCESHWLDWVQSVKQEPEVESHR